MSNISLPWKESRDLVLDLIKWLCVTFKDFLTHYIVYYANLREAVYNSVTQSIKAGVEV